MALAKWGGITRGLEHSLDVYERAILHLMQQHWAEITPTAAASKLGINRETVVKRLQSLQTKGLLSAHKSPRGRAMRYSLPPAMWSGN
ncbi:hypothetical protein A8990_12383 [Paenibacillus taihuensis]|uniref:HTH domain-containing protein n=1 Tax=Paenibacillus taihuensis TaxID=1156355 RepID=A0A3D9RRA9_9BACL|nr:hypothetical protein A8990_12383 [Paenibacillus taihuensis]